MKLATDLLAGVCVGGVSVLALTSGSAFAQDNDNEDWLEDDNIIVTATKRDQSIQDVPISITAFSESGLEKIGADGFEDYLAQTPGVDFSSVGIAFAKPTIRGIATGSAPGQGQAPVGIYIDELPSLTRAFPFAATDLRVFDLERVEILRGPQGTLFGSGSAGGAIRLITNKPDTDQLSAKAEVGLASVKGGGVNHTYNGMLNVPIVDGKAAMRVVGYYREDAGYIDNIYRNVEDTGEVNSFGGRAMFSYEPTDDLSLRFSGIYQNDKQDTDSPTGFYDPADGGIDEYDTIDSNGSDIELTILNFTGEYDFGGMTLFSSTSYGETKAGLNKDNDRQVLGLAPLFGVNVTESNEAVSTQGIDAKTFAQEIRLMSTNDSSFQWLIGGFFLDQKFDVTETWTIPSVDFYPVDVNIGANTQELALFGEGSYAFTDRLTVTAGARLFKNIADTENVGTIFGNTDIQTGEPAEETSITPKFAISFKANENVNLYAQAAKGYRVGRANFAITDPVTMNEIPSSYESDSLWNYEAGIKSTLLDNRMTFNVAAFFIDWSNIQLGRVVDGNGITDNAGDAESKGFELEVDYSVSDWLRVGGSYAYIDAELTKVLPGTFATAGNVLPGSAKNSFSAFIEMTKDSVFRGADGYVRIDKKYTGKKFDDLDNADAFESDDYMLVNLNAGLQWNNYELVLYASNLLDNRVAVAQFDASSDKPSRARYTPPRTIGFKLRMDF